MFALAHLSDVHLAPITLSLREITPKRVLGFINWQRRRRAIHRIEIAEAITHDLLLQKPDHVAVTGDLVNIAMMAEFARAQSWLKQLGTPNHVTLVPGNHDAYVKVALAHQNLHWSDYMRGDETQSPMDGAVAFPFVRIRGSVALIGLSSAIPTPLFMASGRLGDAQIHQLGKLLAKLRHDYFRVILIHHPPVTKRSHRFKWLSDAQRLRQVVAQFGAELIIHGHEHIHSLDWLDGPESPIPAIGVPSASASPLGNGHHECAAYNIYRIAGEPKQWICDVISRGYRAGGNEIIELSRRSLTYPAIDDIRK